MTPSNRPAISSVIAALCSSCLLAGTVYGLPAETDTSDELDPDPTSDILLGSASDAIANDRTDDGGKLPVPILIMALAAVTIFLTIVAFEVRLMLQRRRSSQIDQSQRDKVQFIFDQLRRERIESISDTQSFKGGGRRNNRLGRTRSGIQPIRGGAVGIQRTRSGIQRPTRTLDEFFTRGPPIGGGATATSHTSSSSESPTHAWIYLRDDDDDQVQGMNTNGDILVMNVGEYLDDRATKQQQPHPTESNGLDSNYLDDRTAKKQECRPTESYGLDTNSVDDVREGDQKEEELALPRGDDDISMPSRHEAIRERARMLLLV